MNISQQIAKHFKEVYFGGNWTDVNLKDSLKDISWQQATTKLYSFNTIAALVYHIDYYVTAILPYCKVRLLLPATSTVLIIFLFNQKKIGVHC